MSEKRSRKEPRRNKPLRGRAELARPRRVSEREIRASSPAELADLPDDFWDHAAVVEPAAKQPISLRVDADAHEWFKTQGPNTITDERRPALLHDAAPLVAATSGVRDPAHRSPSHRSCSTVTGLVSVLPAAVTVTM